MAEKKKALTFGELMQNPIYKNRDILYDIVPPNGFVHRVDEKNELIVELSPILMGSKVNYIFVYGPPGTGKTGLMMELMEDLKTEAQKQKQPLDTYYINCSENRTETTILRDIVAKMKPGMKVPKTGWTRAKAIKEFYSILEEKKGGVVLVLDEVDYALKESGDDFLYRLSRIKDNGPIAISTVIISNDVRVSDYLKPKTRSTFGRVKVIFHPYSAEDLYDIVKERAQHAFKSNVVSDAVLKRISELEAERGGDARRALELLDNCAKNAIAKKKRSISLDIVDESLHNLDGDTTLSTLTSLPKHQKILFLALLKVRKKVINSEETYKYYEKECSKYNVDPLTERRVRSFLVTFDELRIIKSEVGWLKDIRKKTRKIRLNIESAIKNKVRKLIRDSI